MSIITVTLNPAIDKTIYCDSFELGATNRIQHVTEDIAGKGINVSKNLREHHLESTLVAVFAGHNGDRSYRFLMGENYNVVKIDAIGETRINQKIVDKSGTTTELNEKGPSITQDTIDDLYTWIKNNVKTDDIVILSGSLPQGAPTDIYGEIIRICHTLSAKTILDASGECLVDAIKAKPFCVKPNDDEIQTLLELDRKPTKEEMLAYGKQLIQEGIEKVVISLGKEGAYFIDKERILKGKGLELKSLSSVGAGDAMVSALAYSFYHHETYDQIVKRAIATSGAAVETEGTKPGKQSRVLELMELVKIEKGA